LTFFDEAACNSIEKINSDDDDDDDDDDDVK